MSGGRGIWRFWCELPKDAAWAFVWHSRRTSRQTTRPGGCGAGSRPTRRGWTLARCSWRAGGVHRRPTRCLGLEAGGRAAAVVAGEAGARAS
jgi:hypothetical protein